MMMSMIDDLILYITVIPQFGVTVFTFLGLIFGSFMTFLIHRLREGKPVVRGADAARSHCPSCGTTLTTLDLIPLLSWMILRGRCRHCGVKIPYFYPMVELTSLILFLGIYVLLIWT